jgi:hypothetical protein
MEGSSSTMRILVIEIFASNIVTVIIGETERAELHMVGAFCVELINLILLLQ